MSQESKGGLKASVQKLGSNLSSMVMPNIGAFIAWGLVAALFIPTGWIPNETLNQLSGPMQTYLLPLLIGYSGGNLVHGQRGAVVGAIATAGVIVGSDIPMFIGAMMMGPLGGWAVKKFDDAFSDKIPTGFEMLVNNFSSGIIGFILAIIAFLAVGPVVTTLTDWIAQGVDIIINAGLLPLANILIEPAKVLFLNNAINHGILTPLGAAEVEEFGKSILFLLEANPGPGLGVLLAYLFFGKGSAKSSSAGAIIIHFLGGIHEIYFPYVMMKPLMFLAVIAGGAAGTFTLQLFDVGLSGPASPGSIIAILGMTPRGNFLGVILGVVIAALVSFLVGALILKMDKSEDDDFDAQRKATQAAKSQSKGKSTEDGATQTDVAVETANEIPSINEVDNIIFACDAGMGSSAMGASLLRKKAKSINLDMSITNSAIGNLGDDANTLIITQEELTNRARQQAPSSNHISVDNFLDGDRYDEILAEMQARTAGVEVETPVVASVDESNESAEETTPLTNVSQVVFGYDEKIGASSMGASLFRNQAQKENLFLEVTTQPVSGLTNDENLLVIGTEATVDKVNSDLPNVQTVAVEDLLDETLYEAVINQLK